MLNFHVLPDYSRIAGYPETMDGDQIIVEIATRKSYRMYSYKDPIFAKEAIKEAKLIVEILRLLTIEFQFRQLRIIYNRTTKDDINLKHVKIYFKHQNTPEGNLGIESAWAIPDGEYYKLDNILFYVPEYSFGDIVSVEDRNGELFVTGLVSDSGHSTV